MLRNRNIAFFIDVDNVGLTSENYDNILAQLEGMGNILMGKIYGAKERKHKSIYQSAEIKGYKVERPMRIKRRGRKDFDSRIFVDVVDTVCKAPAIDAACIVTASCDLVYLYSYLHGKGIKIISSDEGEEASAAMVDEFIDLGRVYEIALPATAKPKAKVKKSAVTKTPTRSAPKTVAKSKVKEPEDNTDELLREIERLRSLADERQAEKEAEEHKLAKEKAIAEARAKAYEEARIAAEKEALAKVKAEEEKRAKAKAEEEARAKAKAEEEARAKARAEEERKAREAEQARAQKAIEEAKAKAYEEARIEVRKEAEARRKAEEEARAKAEAEAEARAKAEEEAKIKEKALREAEARAEALNKKLEELESRRMEEVRAKNDANADELMREIEQLRRLTSETNQLVKEMKEEPKEQPVILRYEVPEKKSSEKSKTKAATAEPATTTAQETPKEDNTEQLMREIEHWKSIAESQPKETAASEAEAQNTVRTYYIPQSDSTLIRKIEEIHNNSDADEDELLEEIRKLLEGLD